MGKSCIRIKRKSYQAQHKKSKRKMRIARIFEEASMSLDFAISERDEPTTDRIRWLKQIDVLNKSLDNSKKSKSPIQDE